MVNGMPTHFAHYQVVNRLGDGGFGTVYLAKDTKLGRQVALKVLRPHLTTDPTNVRRFKREAEALARLSHPNIVTVYSIEDNQHPFYIVMEFVNGFTLQWYLQNRVFSMKENLNILRQIAAALDAAHAQGMVHRDVKPSNVLIAPGQKVKLTDFGIVKMLPADATPLTPFGVVFGTALYIAPEQADISRQHEIGPATDIYALGVMAYRMLTGKLPFDGSSGDIIVAHCTLPPPNPCTFKPNFSPRAAMVLMQALEKQPANRYSTAGDFVKALELAMHPDATTRLAPPPTPLAPLPPPPDGRSRNRRLILAISVVVLLMLGVALAFFASTEVSPVETATSTIGSVDGTATSTIGSVDETATVTITSVDHTPTPPSVTSPPPRAVPKAQVVSEHCLYLRSGPGTEYEDKGCYLPDTEVQVVGREPNGKWLQVETPDGQSGWMFAEYLAVDDPLDEVPVVTTPTPPA